MVRTKDKIQQHNFQHRSNFGIYARISGNPYPH